MKILRLIKNLNKVSVLLFVLFFFHQEGFSQKNTVKITPLKISAGKINVSYERKLNKTWSVIADVQRWSYTNKEVDKKTLFGIGLGSNDRAPILESNKGTRFGLEIRGYFYSKEKKNTTRRFYLGAAGFVGRHSISMKRRAHTIQIGNSWPGGFGITYPKLSGATDLISGGAYFSGGIQFRFKNKVSIEIGGIVGRAWINQENNYLILYNQTPYNLEPEKDNYPKEYSHGIQGAFFQPMLNVGYSF